MRLFIGLLLISLVAETQADIFGTGENQFSIDFSDIGYVGNAADSTGYGAVDYKYRVGKYEITIDQFNKAYAADTGIGNGNESYWNDGTRNVGINAPVSRVSWYEAARFCNWLTTGDSSLGAYLFTANTLSGVNRDIAVATYGTVYVLPTENEWYKAAYYKPVNDGSYALYASGLEDIPVHGSASGWNYYSNGFVNTDPNYAWEVGFGGEEQNGTYDMMGNLWEWTESAQDGTLNDLAESRAVRGGAFNETEQSLRSSYRDLGMSPGSLSESFVDIGFRVTAIPEPSVIALIGIFGGGMWIVRRCFPSV